MRGAAWVFAGSRPPPLPALPAGRLPPLPSGPWPRVTGNDTGGIIPYSPALEGQYEQMAEAYCARWHRISKVTSVHRAYGDYISFACIDKPWVFH